MAKLVFDIETSALPLEHFDEAQQEYLFRECRTIADEAARAARRAEIQQQFNLWPFTAQVVCIAMLNADTRAARCCSRRKIMKTNLAKPDRSSSFPAWTKSELLTAFWDVAKHYDSIVTFNGRGFDVPFIYLRSALLNVPDFPQGLAGLPLSDRSALRSGRATHVLRCQRPRRRGAPVQSGFLLQSVRHRIAEKPRRDGNGRQYIAGCGTHTARSPNIACAT